MPHVVVQDCFDSLMMGTWPRIAAIVGFGLDSVEHYGALQHAIRHGATVEELDAVLGDGDKITALCRRFPGNPYQATFRTAYDTFNDE